MNKAQYSILYVLISSILNILFTAIVISVLGALSFVILYYIVHAKSEHYAVAFFGSFTAGLALSFFLYTKISSKLIQKLKIAEKFESFENKNKTTMNDEEPKQTVMPDSVLEYAEDEKWREQ